MMKHLEKSVLLVIIAVVLWLGGGRRSVLMRPMRNRSNTIEKAFAAASPLLSVLMLAGSATLDIGLSVLDARAQAPSPSKSGAYPPVEIAPPPRAVAPMTAEEQSTLKKDLTAARDRQPTSGKNKRGRTEGTKP